MDEKIEKYIVDIVFATRSLRLKELDRPYPVRRVPARQIYLSVAAKAYAFLQGRGYVAAGYKDHRYGCPEAPRYSKLRG